MIDKRSTRAYKLEKENKRLKEENKRLNELDKNYPIEEQLEEALKYKIIYKSRIDKAIEYIKSFGGEWKNYSIYYNEIMITLLNILEGSDKE